MAMTPRQREAIRLLLETGAWEAIREEIKPILFEQLVSSDEQSRRDARAMWSGLNRVKPLLKRLGESHAYQAEKEPHP